MEKLQGKLITNDGVRDLAAEFVDWAGPHSAHAHLALEGTELRLELATSRKSPGTPSITARGLAGGGSAVAAWAESEGYEVVTEQDDHITVEAAAADAPDTALGIAKFLAPAGRWRIVEMNARRKA